MVNKKNPLFKKIIEALILAVTGFFVLKMVYESWDIISQHIEDANYWLLLLAWITSLIYFFLRGLAWRQLILSLGEKLSFSQANRIWQISEFSRYIPGNIWSFLRRIYLAKDAGISRKITVVSLFLEIVMLLGSSIVFMGLFFLLMPYKEKFISPWLFLLVIPVIIILLSPKLLKGVINFALTKVKKPIIDIELTFLQLLLILIMFTVGWAFYGLSAYLAMSAFIVVSSISAIWLISVFVVAWLVGYISFITPMGLGVREGILTLALNPVIGSGLAGFVAIVTRVWLVISELSVLGIIYAVDTLKGRNE